MLSTRVVTPPTAAARVAVSNLGTENKFNPLFILSSLAVELTLRIKTNSPLPGSPSGFIDMNMAVNEAGH